ncbi:MAG: hypothetical protein QXS37_03295 [Candidatus Aenigmatarchaeota archaeon]
MNKFKILKYAIEKVPFYRKRKELYKTQSWEKLPIITRRDLEKSWKDFLSNDYRDLKNLSFRLTTGTTGKPIKIFYSPFYYFKMNFSYLKTLLKCGYKITKSLVHYDPFLPRRYFFQKVGLYKKIWINADLSEKQQLQFLSKYNKVFLSYFPTSLLFVIFESKNRNIKLGSFYKIFTQGEVLFDSVREYIQNELNATVIDLYGVVEHGLLAYEIQKNLYKLPNELAFFEVVDENNEQVSEDERGKVILTTLGNYAFPLIRYEVGDFATVKEFNDKGYINLVSDINRISLEVKMKNRRKLEKTIFDSLKHGKKFIVLYRKGKFFPSYNKRFIKKNRGKYVFLQ